MSLSVTLILFLEIRAEFVTTPTQSDEKKTFSMYT